MSTHQRTAPAPSPAAVPPPSPAMPPGADVLTMAIAALQANAAKAVQFLVQIDQLLPGLLELTKENRLHAARFRNGEAAALLPVLDLADQKPVFFQALADEDQGNDPNVFEVALLRDRLQRIAALQPLVTELEKVSQTVSDTVLSLSEKTKPVMQTAYEMVKPQAKHDAKVQTVLAPTIDYYAAIAKAAAETRAANKQKQQQAQAGHAAAAPPKPGAAS